MRWDEIISKVVGGGEDGETDVTIEVVEGGCETDGTIDVVVEGGICSPSNTPSPTPAGFRRNIVQRNS